MLKFCRSLSFVLLPLLRASFCGLSAQAPVRFVENQGQWQSEVLYPDRYKGVSVRFRDCEEPRGIVEYDLLLDPGATHVLLPQPFVSDAAGTATIDFDLTWIKKSQFSSFYLHAMLVQAFTKCSQNKRMASSTRLLEADVQDEPATK